VLTDRQSVVSREKDRYGGIKWGSAFFGWLTATGTAVILTALLVAAGTAVGVATDTDPADVQGQVSQQPGAIGRDAVPPQRRQGRPRPVTRPVPSARSYLDSRQRAERPVSRFEAADLG
jgi:hypothetical protein